MNLIELNFRRSGQIKKNYPYLDYYFAVNNQNLLIINSDVVESQQHKENLKPKGFIKWLTEKDKLNFKIV